MPAVGRQSDAGDEAHGNTVCPRSVIPGRSEATSPESITTIVSMDSGPAPRGASRNDELQFLAFLHLPKTPQYDFGRPSTFSAMKLRMSCGLIGAMRGIRDSRK